MGGIYVDEEGREYVLETKAEREKRMAENEKLLLELIEKGKECTTASEFEEFRDLVDDEFGYDYVCAACPVSQECNFASEYKETLREKGLIISDDIDDCDDIFATAMKVKLDE